jgi:hypothetical protein
MNCQREGRLSYFFLWLAERSRTRSNVALKRLKRRLETAGFEKAISCREAKKELTTER